VKARAAPAAELLEDVVRTPRPASSEALSWRHPFSLYHFQEGIKGRCTWQALRQALPWMFIPARRCRAPGKALPFAGKEGKKASPPCREGSFEVKTSPLAGRKWSTREGSGSVSKDKTSRHVASISHGAISCHPLGPRARSPLRWTCRRPHYHGWRGNDGQDRLVESFACKLPSP
jgi:hypothetical protein